MIIVETSKGAKRERTPGRGRPDLLPPRALMEIAKQFERGANKYGDRTWENGMPVEWCLESALRHLLKHMAGQDDEDHLVAAATNLLMMIELRERSKEANKDNKTSIKS